MGLIWEIFKALGEGESTTKREKRISDEIFDTEADANGLDECEKNEFRESGMTPDEYAEEKDPNYEE